MNIDFWFEFASTYSYPAAMRIEGLARDRGVTLSWRPFLLGPIFREQGWSDSPFNLYPAKGRYMWRDLERICQGAGIAFHRPSDFPRNSVLATRVACRFSQAGWLPDFVRAVYAANFAKDLDISEPATVAACLDAAGVEADPVLEAAQTPESKAKLRAQTQEAVDRGIFGAPSFMVGQELFWGNDRLEQALSWAVDPRTVGST
jgi:2-hydroxychromene-2-carboxylate isomerase